MSFGLQPSLAHDHGSMKVVIAGWQLITCDHTKKVGGSFALRPGPRTCLLSTCFHVIYTIFHEEGNMFLATNRSDLHLNRKRQQVLHLDRPTIYSRM